MMAFKMVFLLAGVLMLTSVAFINGSFLDDIGDVFKTITQITCPEKHLKEVDKCHTLVAPLYVFQAALEQNKEKADCCNRLSAYDCLGLVTRWYCSETTGDVAEFFVKLFDKIATGGQCGDFESISNCISPIILIFGFVLFVMIIICILKCIFICICGGSRRHNRNDYY